MNFLIIIKRFLVDKSKRFSYLSMMGLLNWMSDEKYIKKRWETTFPEKLNLNDPKTFNEKLQWLKLYNRIPLYSTLVDKYKVKKYITEKIGKEYVIQTLGVWEKFDEIDFDSLPNQFVLKCTHDSGGLVICKDKQAFDKKNAKQKINRSLKKNYYYHGREWPYKNVKARIIAEQYMEDTETKELRDYKFFCFNGKVKCFKIDFDRATHHRANYYDENGSLLPFGEAVCPPDHSRNIKLPKELNKMIELAERLATDIPFVRVDFYDANGHIYFGEMTFYPASGFGKFIPEEWDYKLGEWLTLPGKK